MKLRDPIVEEIHAVREALANEQGNDLEKIALAARAFAEKQTGRRPETLPPRRIPPTKKAS